MCQVKETGGVSLFSLISYTGTVQYIMQSRTKIYYFKKLFVPLKNREFRLFTIKTALILFLSFFLILSVLSYYSYSRACDRRMDELRQLHRNELDLMQAGIRGHVSGIISDLDILHRYTSALLRNRGGDVSAISGNLAFFFADAASAKKRYNQIRFIDAEGMERVRVDFANGGIVSVPQAKLQNKKGRYFFVETMKRPSSEVYLSQFDLNIENGSVEVPYKPMIRIGRRVENAQGEPIGCVIINYFGDDLIDQMQRLKIQTADRLELLNGEGYWLYHPDASKRWGFMLDAKSSMALESPMLWRIFSSEQSGFASAGGDMYSFITLMSEELFNCASSADTGRTALQPSMVWKLAVVTPSHEIRAERSILFSENMNFFSVIFPVSAGFALVIAFLAAHLGRAYENMRTYAMHDALTGLYNRRVMIKRLFEEADRSIRSRENLSFIMLDIDYFKKFNDLYGHETGDLVLKVVAKCLLRASREMDIVSRFGGEEFTVLVPGCEIEEVTRIGERIRSTVENERIRNRKGEELSVTVSVGVVSFSSEVIEAVNDIDAVINMADSALYRAKRKGRNCVVTG